MTMSTPQQKTVTVNVAQLEQAQGYIQAARDYYAAAFNGISGPGPVRTNFIAGCAQLTSLIALAESVLGQDSGTLMPSGGTGKGV